MFTGSTIDELLELAKRIQDGAGGSVEVKEGQMKTELYRQGDVLIRRIDRLPEQKPVKRASGHILEGEATGHIHRLEDVSQAEVLEAGEGLYLRVGEEGVRIIHEEHAPIVLPPGNFEVVRQREYAPEEIRNVAD